MMFGPISEQPVQFKMLLYGPPGSGKTTLAGSAPRPIFLDTEGGLVPLRHRQDLLAARIQSTEDFSAAYAWLLENQDQYDTVVVDSLSQLQSVCLDSYMKHVVQTQSSRDINEVELRDWSVNTQQMRRIIRAVRNLPKHIIFVALEDQREDNMGIVRMGPALTPKVAHEAMAAVDTIGRLVVSNNGERELLVAPRPLYIAKDRTGLLEQHQGLLIQPNLSALMEAVQSAAPPAQTSTQPSTPSSPPASIRRLDKRSQTATIAKES